MKSITAPIVALGGLFCLLACTPRSEPEQEQAVVVRVERARRDSIRSTIEAFGTVTYVEKADVFSTVEGVITELYVEEGDRVVRGDLLARIDREPLLLRKTRFEAELRARRARSDLAQQRLVEGRREVEAQLIRIAKAEREIEQRRLEYETLAATLENKQRLFEAGGIAEQELEALSATVSSAHTALEQAEEDLRIRMLGFRDTDMQGAGMTPPEDIQQRQAMLVALNTRALKAELQTALEEITMVEVELMQIELLLERALLIAPIDGVISARYGYIGEQANADRPIFTIFGTDRLDVQVEVGEEHVGSLVRGQIATIVCQGEEYAGQVRLIQPFVDVRSRSAVVRIGIEDGGQTLLPGLFARAVIETDELQQWLTVPEAALLDDATGGQSLYLVRDNHLYRTAIEVGARIGDRRIITAGIDEADQVVLEPSPSYRDGLLVEAVE